MANVAFFTILGGWAALTGYAVWQNNRQVMIAQSLGVPTWGIYFIGISINDSRCTPELRREYKKIRKILVTGSSIFLTAMMIVLFLNPTGRVGEF